MKKLYFVRHGLSEMNISGHFAGFTDTPLTVEGRKQAKKAGIAAKDLEIDYIITSPLSRAFETAKIIAQEIGYPIEKIHKNSILIERYHGSLEGTPWSPDINLDGFTDVESTNEILERAQLAFNLIESLDANNILVVSHGGFGRALRHHATGHPYHLHNEKLPNAEVIQWL